jgi:TolB-like protein/Tfp pilus assembly protein PilF
MKDVTSNSRTIRFGTFELDVQAGELRKQGTRIKLQEQPLRILEMLLNNPGQLVTREALRSVLWPTNTFVDFDHGLNKAINKLRDALGDTADSPRFIETLAKRGYRFLGDVGGDPREIRSLLVLPLENLSQDPEQGYFADGLTEALTTTLAKISALRVLSRTTAVSYKRAHKSLPDMVRELGVDGIIEGSVLRSGGRVRISAQLLHAPTDTHLWAESYDRDMRDILALQAEVASAIAKAIQVKVTVHEQTQLAHAPVVDPEAYDAYLRGRFYWDKRTLDATRMAIELFEQAIGRDPTFSAAHVGRAECTGALGWWGHVPPAEAFPRAKRQALRIIELNPGFADGHSILAWATLHCDYDFLTAEEQFRRAIELDPRSSLARYRYALSLTFAGRFEEAIEEAKGAVSLDPLSAMPNGALIWAYWFARQFDLQLAYSRTKVELHADAPYIHWGVAAANLEIGNFDAAITSMQLAVETSGGATLYLAILSETHAVAGHRDDALAILHRLQDGSSERYVTPYMFGRIYAALGQKDEAFRWLDIAYEQRAPWMVLLKHDPRLDSLRSDSRYEALLRRMNFPS